MDLRHPLKRAGVVATFVALLFCAGVSAAAPAGHPSLTTADGDELVPGFDWGVKTYGARCNGDGLSLGVTGAPGWRAAVGGEQPRGGDLELNLDLAAGDGARVSFVRRDGAERRIYVRCMPEDMPAFTFQTHRPGGPKFFTVQMAPRYGVVMSRDGAPVWWLASADLPFDSQVLRDGTFAWNAGGLGGVVDDGRWEVRTLAGDIVRTVSAAAGGVLDIHDYLQLPNGNDLVGVGSFESGVDTTAYGGSADAEIRNTTIEELTPKGHLVRSWNSGEHIGLDQTPARWWTPILTGTPYDVSHWNAVDVVGKFMYLSFRHLDAVYKVNRRTGRIVWKLGGTKTAKSLEVRGDPRGDDPLNGQHDVNVYGDGTISVLENSTILDRAPRAVRYRIDEEKGIARFVEQFRDRDVVVSAAGGSFRRFDGGWLAGWGVSNPSRVDAYDRSGRKLFRLTYQVSASYRAIPVPEGTTGGDLRRAMNEISR